MTYEEHLVSDFGSLLVERAKLMAENDELRERIAEQSSKIVTLELQIAEGNKKAKR